MNSKKIIFYVINKLIKAVILISVLCIISFWMVKNSPIDPVRAYIGADMTRVSQEQYNKIANYWGLDKPPIIQFKNWFFSIIKGDFGTSMIYRNAVLDVIRVKFLNSLMLMGTAWFFSGIFGFVFGCIAGYFQNTWIDKIIKWFCLTLASTPTFWFGLILLIIFAVYLGLFPIGLGVPAGVLTEDVSFISRLHHLILPALTLSIIGIPNIALHTRQKLIDILESEFVLFAKARGEKGIKLLYRHGIRNIALPAVTLQFASFSEIFGGSILAEQVFSYPGLGQATVQAGIRGDVPLLLAIVIFSAMFVFSGNLIADFIYRIVDPRIRLGGSI